MRALQIPIGGVAKPDEARSGWIANATARGLALFFGGFALTNLLGNLRAARFDANLWWIDLRWFPASLANAFLAIAGICLIGVGLHPPGLKGLRRVVLFCAAILALISLANAANFFVLLTRHDVSSSVPLPLSLMVSLSMLLICRAVLTSSASSSSALKLWPALMVCLACALVFPLAEMLCFGKTDYRRRADVTVVLGCRVYADGRPSDALKDRVRTACQLYREGWTRKLLFSGGPGDGATSEVEAMKTLAIQLGVKAEDIVVDDQGLNTQATVRNTKAILSKMKASRVLVVSHFYHLPRIKLAYQRAGCEVFTVPARESYLLRQMPYNMAREVAALWVYYMRPLAG